MPLVGVAPLSVHSQGKQDGQVPTVASTLTSELDREALRRHKLRVGLALSEGWGKEGGGIEEE